MQQTIKILQLHGEFFFFLFRWFWMKAKLSLINKAGKQIVQKENNRSAKNQKQGNKSSCLFKPCLNIISAVEFPSLCIWWKEIGPSLLSKRYMT